MPTKTFKNYEIPLYLFIFAFIIATVSISTFRITDILLVALYGYLFTKIRNTIIIQPDTITLNHSLIPNATNAIQLKKQQIIKITYRNNVVFFYISPHHRFAYRTHQLNAVIAGLEAQGYSVRKDRGLKEA
ncbi:MAG: hypothetical protein ACRC5C_13045 [Bacilli bacterium]